jgi:hypothetical protein
MKTLIKKVDWLNMLVWCVAIPVTTIIFWIVILNLPSIIESLIKLWVL